MGLFDFFKPKSAKPAKPQDDFDEYGKRVIRNFNRTDYLGKAAIAREKAKKNVSAGNFETAWKLFHDEKHNLMLHANRCGFTKSQILALDGSVSEALANILRLEGKHHDAMIHILYWVASSTNITKNHDKKLTEYFNRCGFKQISSEELLAEVADLRLDPEFEKGKMIVSTWKQRCYLPN